MHFPLMYERPLPSGSQRKFFLTVPSEVICCCSVPSRFAVQILLPYTYAILSAPPITGGRSGAVVAVGTISTVGVRLGAVVAVGGGWVVVGVRVLVGRAAAISLLSAVRTAAASFESVFPGPRDLKKKKPPTPSTTTRAANPGQSSVLLRPVRAGTAAGASTQAARTSATAGFSTMGLTAASVLRLSGGVVSFTGGSMMVAEMGAGGGGSTTVASTGAGGGATGFSPLGLSEGISCAGRLAIAFCRASAISAQDW